MVITTGDTATYHSNNYDIDNQNSNNNNVVKLAMFTSNQNHNNSKTESHDCDNDHIDVIRDTIPLNDTGWFFSLIPP